MSEAKSKTKLPVSKKEILNDYKLAVESREASLIGRKEVFMGKAKFGIFGDGKEVPQIAMAKYFQNGDWRSGYYRDQTFMMAIGQLNTEQFFAQLYAHTDVEADPASAGRMMNGHFATRYLNEKGEWLTQTDKKNSSADISPTAGQMPRLLGLAYASKLYRENKGLEEFEDFSIKGNEVAFGTIGNASTSEGHFWETMNAAGVLQVPMVMSVWDDEFGISVPQKYHTIKESISDALSGFQRSKDKPGFEIFKVRAWDYPALLDTYKKAVETSRKKHIPCLIHVVEVTQPQGHSTSGSHERYKTKDRLNWEKEHDCILKMREWIISENLATAEELDAMEKEAKQAAKQSKDQAWKSYSLDIKKDVEEALNLIEKAGISSSQKDEISRIVEDLRKELNPEKSNVIRSAKQTLRLLKNENSAEKQTLANWLKEKSNLYSKQFNSKLYSQSEESALNVETIPATYSDSSELVDGREVLNACFDNLLKNDPRIFAFGEDVGKIGDVNQGFAGLQEKYGELKVTDTGIRETTIIGQGIGAAIRGLRPIAEIQYLDYLLYAIQTLSDDLATLQYRTYGGQKAPLIIRTRGHRLEGVWHSGSPMGMILHSLRGIYVLTPRNMTQAAGFYNTLLQSDDPALVIESLNGYRLKERVPDNLTEFKLALGEPEILREGSDVTIVTYGSTCRIVMEAANQLAEEGIEAEVIDAQTLIPFDRPQMIVNSLEKTNRLVVVDEDVEGGASAFILQQILERDNGYFHLDSKPTTITGKNHRPAYGSDGDYFSKPNVEDVFDRVYALMSEANPESYPSLY
ncbi:MULTISPECIES: thiamine pyrophosphate-dependent enzyme [unclassified Ekhidna]|jgi:2-oxoisovalerate dehydrogenase E1 component|uniref:thiamine pyrophosphate-dependent enzyme n=1 Tax=unclassified Ekhidna TaxID=2632188 RepID=UPI0032DE750A